MAPPLTLLIVEDDEAAIGVLKTVIPKKFPGVAIHIAGNGPAGLEICKAHAPDIVITDINLPGMDGARMTEEIKSLRPDTRFIVITGYSDLAHLDRFRSIGISDYLLKPVKFNELFDAIERMSAPQ